MAIYSVQCKIIGRGQKKSSGAVSLRTVVAAAAYRAGEKLRNLTENALYDFTRKQGVVCSEILLPEGAPERYRDRETLWNEVESAERRHDAQFCRELVIALPVELSRADNLKLARRYIQDQLVDRGMCADFSFHDPNPRGGQRNPHVHVLVTMRDLEQGCFKNKNRDWNQKVTLEGWREQWAVYCNDYLRQQGFDARIDHRSYKEQGVDQAPTVHLGVQVTAMERRGVRTEKGNLNRSIRAHNAAKECGVGSPTILASLNQMWQQAADRRRVGKVASAPQRETDARGQDGPGRDTCGGSVQRRTYTSRRDVVRQGTGPAPEREEKDAQRGPSPGKWGDKRTARRGQEADPAGEASRQPVTEPPQAERVSLLDRLGAWLAGDTAKHAVGGRGAAVYDIKVMSSTLRFLSEQGIDSYSKLEAKLSQLTALRTEAEKEHAQIKSRIRETTRVGGVLRTYSSAGSQAELLRGQLKDTERLLGAALRCQANRQLFEQYAGKVLFRENFYKLHQDKLDTYARASAELKVAGFSENTPPEQFRQPLERLKEELKKQNGRYRWAIDELKAADFDETLTPEQLQVMTDELRQQSEIVWQALCICRQEVGRWQHIQEQVDNVLEGRRAKEPRERTQKEQLKDPGR